MNQHRDPHPLLVFVYGTLKEGYGNWNRYLRHSKKVCDARTAPKYVLFGSGCPFLVDHSDIPREARQRIPMGLRCFGEIYEVTPEVLKDLDRLEGHPGFYLRQHVRVDEPTKLILMNEGYNPHLVEAYICETPTGYLLGDYWGDENKRPTDSRWTRNGERS